MLRLHYYNDEQYADLLRDEGLNLETGADLETAVLISLFTERLVDASEVPDSYRGGYWAEAYITDRWGSRLWLLRSAKATPGNVARAKTYIEEALQWLVVDGVAESVNARTRRGTNGSALWFEVSVTRRDGTVWAQAWEAQLDEF